MTKLITITTDFGDHFAGSQLRAVLASDGYCGGIVENHDVSPFGILEGAYGIWQLSKHCPQRAIHVGIVDPGVGSERNGIVVECKRAWYVGPDNGMLWESARQDGIVRYWKINEEWFGGRVSNTFHGRDVFVRVAAKLSEGKTPGELGCQQVAKIRRLDFQDGQVLHIDNYGNVKFFWERRVRVGDKLFDIVVVKTFSDVAIGKPLILNGSSDLLELAVNCGSAMKVFEVKLGEDIRKFLRGGR